MDSHLPPELGLTNVEAAAKRLAPYVRQTPSFDWPKSFLEDEDISVSVKFELWQTTHTFKPRGALNVLLNTPADQLKNGIVAQSRGNHALAVAYAAQMLGHHAKLVLPKSAPKLRIARCKDYGAEVVLAPDAPSAFALADDIVANEGRFRVHPYEGVYTCQGTATIALEWAAAAGKLDTVLIPVGGGGLIAGMGAAFKQINPACRVIGIEAEGAPTLYESLQAGAPVRPATLNTIADSIAVPTATPVTFGIFQQVVDEVVLISDAEMQSAMRLIWREWQLMVEPACAATTAGLLHLKERLRGQPVIGEVCGARKQRVSMIAAWCNKKRFAPMTFTGSCNANVVNAWIKDVLIPKLEPGQTVIMDNARFHKKPETAELIKNAGCQLRFLPPYSPDLNPIENVWHTIKSTLRKNYNPNQNLHAKLDHAIILNTS